MQQDDQFIGGTQGDDGNAGAGQGAGAQGDATQDEVLSFMQATPPPEPRGSAYMSTPEYAQFATTVALPEHPTQFEEKYFLFLFAGSLSLKLAEKKDIIEKIPTLSQFQIIELMKILEEEKQKFDELEKKHPDQVQKLRKEAFEEWQLLEMESHKTEASSKDAADAEEIRKKLGL